MQYNSVMVCIKILEMMSIKAPLLWTLLSFYYASELRLLLVKKVSYISPLPMVSQFVVCPMKRQRLFLYLFRLGWPCDLLGPTECGGSKVC